VSWNSAGRPLRTACLARSAFLSSDSNALNPARPRAAAGKDGSAAGRTSHDRHARVLVPRTKQQRLSPARILLRQLLAL
jgi:hypothetical protein